jgi:hypothetical protein
MKLNQVHSVEARALARQLADGADGSAAAGRMWKGLIRDLSAAAQAEREEASRVWFAADPDKRRFLPKDCGPCSIALRELGEAMNADNWGGDTVYTVTGRPPVKEGLRPGHAVQDWLDKYFGKIEDGQDSDALHNIIPGGALQLDAGIDDT